jgi:hypothetical protein
VTATTPARTSGHNIEASSDSSNSDNSNEKNVDEPPTSDNSSGQNNDNNNSNDNNKHGFHNKCESLDEGTFAFMCWMNSTQKTRNR